MNLTHFLLFLVISLVATLPVIFGRRSDGNGQLNRLSLFQAVLGPVAMTFGVVYLVTGAGNQGIVGTIIYSVEFLIGFLMTCGMLSRYFVQRGDTAAANRTRARINQYQAPLGVLGVALCALWMSQGL